MPNKKKDRGLNEIKDLLRDNTQEKIMLGIMDILRHNEVEEFYYSQKFDVIAWNDNQGVGHKHKRYLKPANSKSPHGVNISSVLKHGK